VIVGLVNLLNSKVQFENIYSDTESSVVVVPFFYNFGGDERFLQDYFLHWNDCVTPQMVDGNIDPIPRGIVTLSSSTINTNMLTNRFVRGNYVKQVGNEVLTYNAFLNSIPLTMNFDVEIYADTSLDAFKIQQSVLETFYKTQVFSVEFRGFRVPCQVGFPEDQGIEKTFEFTYQSDTTIKFVCPLQLETYFPVTDPTTERFGGNRMNYPGGPNLEFISDEKYARPRFTFTTPNHQETYFSSGAMLMQWSNTGPITRVNLYYRVIGTSNWVPIVKNLQNTGYYNWVVPFLDGSGAEVNGESTQATAISPTGEGSRLRAITNSLGQVESIIVFNGGLAYEGIDNILVTKLNVPETSYTTAVVTPNVISGEIAGGTINNPGANYDITPINQIELKIEDANNENTWQVLEFDAQFTGDLMVSTNIIANITPDISVPSNLESLGLFLGQTINGAGLPVNSKIGVINTVSNSIAITPGNATNTLSANLVTANGSKAVITIK
jgi:hypothetical protein